MKCPKCGAPMKKSDMFCGNCGERRRKRKAVWIPLLILVAAVAALCIGAKRTGIIDTLLEKVTGEKTPEIVEVFRKYTDTYTIKEEKEDGGYLVSVEAPDLMGFVERYNNEELIDLFQSGDFLEKFEGSAETREYILSVDNLDSGEIEEKMRRQLEEGLLILAITGTDMPEDWGE